MMTSWARNALLLTLLVSCEWNPLATGRFPSQSSRNVELDDFFLSALRSCWANNAVASDFRHCNNQAALLHCSMKCIPDGCSPTPPIKPDCLNQTRDHMLVIIHCTQHPSTPLKARLVTIASDLLLLFSVLNNFVNNISKSLTGLIIKSQNLATVDDKCLHMSIKLDFLVQIHQPIKCLHFVFCIKFLFAGCWHHKIVVFYSLKPKFFRWSKLCNDLLDDCKTHCRISMEKCWRKRIWCYIKFYVPVEWQKLLILLKRFCLSTFLWECIFEFEFENINSYGPSEWQKLLL